MSAGTAPEGQPVAASGSGAGSAALSLKPETRVAAWIAQQQEAETERLREQGAKVIPLTAQIFGLRVRPADEEGAAGTGTAAQSASAVKADDDETDGVVWNLLSFATAFDFTKVRQILLSEPVDCPEKENHKYVNVVCFTRKPVPLLLPYLYDTTVAGNDLRRFCFINNKGAEARHVIEGEMQEVRRQ